MRWGRQTMGSGDEMTRPSRHRCLLPQASLTREDGLGRQAIHHASQAGATAALWLLIQEGADVNVRAGVTSITALHYAAKVGCRQQIVYSLSFYSWLP